MSAPVEADALSKLLDERVTVLAPLVADWRKRWDSVVAARHGGDTKYSMAGVKDLDQLAFEIAYGAPSREGGGDEPGDGLPCE